MKLGFLGAGRMSRPLIENLLADGHEVTVWNRSADKVAPLVQKGATQANTPKEACGAAGVVISCLAGDGALREIFENQFVERALGEGGVHVSMSTISAHCTRDLAERHKGEGVAYVAAPILGRPDAVAARRQSFVVAGPPEAKARVRPLLDALGKNVFDFGDEPGAANVAKINFNFLIASALEAMAEAFAVTEKAGVNAKTFHEMATATLFGCPLYENYGSQILEQRFDPALFTLTLGLKDVGLADQQAENCNAKMPLAQLLRERFSKAVDNGRGDQDWTAIAAEVRTECGLQ